MPPVLSNSRSSRLVIRKPLITKNVVTPLRLLPSVKRNRLLFPRNAGRNQLEWDSTTVMIESARKPSSDGILRCFSDGAG